MAAPTVKRFEVVEDADAETGPGPTPTQAGAPDPAILANTLALLLKGLSQKALVAVSNCFTALSLATAFWLWSTVLPNPTPNQLVGLGGYAVFVLLLEFVRRR